MTKTPPSKDEKKRPAGTLRQRTKYSNVQLNVLEAVFAKAQYPDSTVLGDLASSLSVTVDKLSIWFQNRRSKFKRQSKNQHVVWMRQQLFQGACAVPETGNATDSGNDKLHVLTPRVHPPYSNISTDPSLSANKSHIGYTSPPHVTSGMADCSYSYHSETPSPHRPCESGTGNLSPEATITSLSDKHHLLLSHLLNDISQQQEQQYHNPYYQQCHYPQTSVGYSNSNNVAMTTSANDFHHQQQQSAFYRQQTFPGMHCYQQSTSYPSSSQQMLIPTYY